MKYRVLHYIIRFLVGDDLARDFVETIGYTADPSRFDRYSVVIIPSGFFKEQTYGTPASLPEIPLQEIEGVPLLFGSPKGEWIGNTWVVHADIIASTYFLITRYEEILQRGVRDEHGRFPGKESLPYRAGFLHRPIVDEYRLLLHRWLRQAKLPVSKPGKQIRKIYLTHDVDAPTLYRTWKGVLRSIWKRRGLYKSLQSKFETIEKDPYYTFPWLFKQDNKLRELIGKQQCHPILFIRGGGNTRQDKPSYNLRGKDMSRLIASAIDQDISIGLHSSYQAGVNPALINKEKKWLEKIIGKKIRFNRHHFLNCREPEDMDQLEAAGCTDDFTMGYADVAGFRLGTSYPVRWINPITRRLSPLRLHPLIIMDSTLETAKYMGMDHDQAVAYCLNLIDRIEDVGGEVVLLWHNTSVLENSESYLRKLYIQLIERLTQR